jgi:hypothetical protein
VTETLAPTGCLIGMRPYRVCDRAARFDAYEAYEVRAFAETLRPSRRAMRIRAFGVVAALAGGFWLCATAPGRHYLQPQAKPCRDGRDCGESGVCTWANHVGTCAARCDGGDAGRSDCADGFVCAPYVTYTWYWGPPSVDGICVPGSSYPSAVSR